MHFLTVSLVMMVIFVNGWTDAPNAITGVVAGGVMKYTSAVLLAAVCNLLGVACMVMLSTSVSDTMLSLIDFEGQLSAHALAALLAGMLSIVLFAVSAWWFGIPTSESHALIASLLGSGYALSSKIGDYGAIQKVFGGLAYSLVAGFTLGLIMYGIVRAMHRRKGLSDKTLVQGQVTATAAMAFMHGAQDGQKFMAVFVIAQMLARGVYNSGPVDMRSHPWVVVICALTMSLGTLVGGRRIIDNVGQKMVHMNSMQGFSADMGCAICLFMASLLGLPVSTTHTKTAAVLGAGYAHNPKEIDWGVVRGMVFAWVITFPVCAVGGYLLTRLALLLT